MHEYAINSDERIKIPFFLALVSITVIGLARSMIDTGNAPLKLYYILPSAFALYGIMIFCFDKFFWKIWVLNKLGIVRVPNLNGPWKGCLRSSRHNYEKEIPISVSIHQTWTKLSISLETNQTESESLMAAFQIKNPSTLNLRWEYISSSRPQYYAKEYSHAGVTSLKITTNGSSVANEISGKYYTDIGRQSYGEIILRRDR